MSTNNMTKPPPAAPMIIYKVILLLGVGCGDDGGPEGTVAVVWNDETGIERAVDKDSMVLLRLLLIGATESSSISADCNAAALAEV
jgi:hypothetical protein